MQMKEKRIVCKGELVRLAVFLTVIGFCLQIYGQYTCPGARPCWACSVRFIAPNRNPCGGGCFSCPPGEQGMRPVDGYCPDELPLPRSNGYTTCNRVTGYTEFICCRWDWGCWANPNQPDGQWGECLRIGYECFNPNTGDICPFIAWTQGDFCIEQDGRPCCNPSQPCQP